MVEASLSAAVVLQRGLGRRPAPVVAQRPVASWRSRRNGREHSQQAALLEAADSAEAVAEASGLNEGRDEDDQPGGRRGAPLSSAFGGQGRRVGLLFLSVQAVLFVMHLAQPPPLSTRSFLSYAWRCVSS
jgi:hypothetical protein